MIPPRTQPRVVVTGIGLISCLGRSTETVWASLREGRIGAGLIELGDGTTSFGFAAPIVGDDDRDPALALLEDAAAQAIADAELDLTKLDPDRFGVLTGLSKGCVRNLVRSHRSILRRESPRSAEWPFLSPSAGASSLSSRFGARGPSLAPIAACATGLVAILQGTDLIRRDVCDLVLAGAADAALDPFILAAFQKMKVLARVDPSDPSSAVRPWDRSRSGFLIGEGAAVLVLENLEHARSRGAKGIVEIAGGAMGADAFHETALNPDPAGLAGLIGRALEQAGVRPEEIDHVNVHGTATASNDRLECLALRLALGKQADRIVCSANKAQIGHLLGAAGAAESAIACLSIRDSFAPPIMNLFDADPDCDLDAARPAGRRLPIKAALKLSIGFGGHFAALCLRRIEPT